MPQTDRCDRRSLRSQVALRQALVSELAGGEDIAHLNVGMLTDRAGLTRRTFYSHYRDIPDFINQVEEDVLDDIRHLISQISAATLPDLYRNIVPKTDTDVALVLSNGSSLDSSACFLNASAIPEE